MCVQLCCLLHNLLSAPQSWHLCQSVRKTPSFRELRFGRQDVQTVLCGTGRQKALEENEKGEVRRQETQGGGEMEKGEKGLARVGRDERSKGQPGHLV